MGIEYFSGFPCGYDEADPVAERAANEVAGSLSGRVRHELHWFFHPVKSVRNVNLRPPQKRLSVDNPAIGAS